MKIKESDLPQGSDLWHQWRLKGIGGSEIASVMGVSPYQTAYQLWQFKTGIKIAPDISENYAVKRGTTLEPKARELVNDMLKRQFEPCLFQDPNHKYMKYSSDGHDENTNELLEIKCLGEKNHNIVCDTNEPLDYYKDQCQWGMLIANCELIHFVSYCPSYPSPLKIIPVKRDVTRQTQLIEESAKFWKLVETKTPPELTSKDFLDVSCEELAALSEKYKQAVINQKLADANVEQLKEEIKKFSAGRNITGNGLKVFMSPRKGNIDYGKIPELKNVDLEQYRKPSTEVLYIRTD